MQSKTSSRASTWAAGLFVLVVACLMAPFGGIVVRALAEEFSGTDAEGFTSLVADPDSDRVGTTAADFGVSQSGDATYSIPLYVVPGTAGVAPSLSLQYSSSGAYGPLGKGWSIGGISSITRCRRTHEAGDASADTAPRPVDFSNNDDVCLDGQRLLLVSSAAPCAAVSGMTAYQFRTEIESFQRVCEYIPTASPNNGPAFFTVEGRDGSTSWYGDRDNNTTANRTDGYFETTSALNPKAALTWAKTRFQDASGNFIDYLYYENPAGAGQGELLLKQVNFTGKTVLPGQGGAAKTAYAMIVFTYSARPADKIAKTYASGGLLVQSRRLDSITSCARVTTCDAPNQARYYQLIYGASPSGNGLETLTSVTECRDSGKAVCLPATTFTWSPGKYEFATKEIPADLDTGGVQHFEDFKLGDVDGDGRLDIAYLKDGEAGGPCGSEYLFVFFSTLGGNSVPTFPRSQGICTPAELFYDNGPGAGSWQLFDYNGDGKDDLFTHGPGGAWVIYPSLGRNSGGVAFNTGVNLLQGISPAIPNMGWKDDQPQIADLNGDGLIDVVYPRDGALRARIMQRSGNGFAWGGERAITIDESKITLPSICSGVLTECTKSIAGAPTPKTGFKQLADFNGDASSDLLIGVKITARTENPGPTCFASKTNAEAGGEEVLTEESWVVLPYAAGGPAAEADSATTAGCWTTQVFDNINAMTVKSIASNAIGLESYGIASQNAKTIVFGDANGDGLTDVFSKNNETWEWSYRVNTGTGFQAPVVLPLGSHFLDQVRFSDVNGDGRTDVLQVVDPGSYKFYRVRYALPSGGYSGETSLPGGDNAHLCDGTGCLANFYVPMFADFDGDGSVDFMSLKIEDSAGVYISRAGVASRFIPRDVITQITNGLGVATKVSYEPMTNKDVYRRGAMLYSLNYGRGSPVIESPRVL